MKTELIKENLMLKLTLPVPNFIVSLDKQGESVKYYKKHRTNLITDCYYFYDVMQETSMEHLKLCQSILEDLEIKFVNGEVMMHDSFEGVNGLCIVLKNRESNVKGYSIMGGIIKYLSVYFKGFSGSIFYPLVSQVVIDENGYNLHETERLAYKEYHTTKDKYDLSTAYGQQRMNLLYFVRNVIDLMIATKAVKA